MKVSGYIVQNLTQNQLNYKKINSRDIPGVYNYMYSCIILQAFPFSSLQTLTDKRLSSYHMHKGIH